MIPSFKNKKDLKCNPNHVFTDYYINKNMFDDRKTSIIYIKKKIIKKEEESIFL